MQPLAPYPQITALQNNPIYANEMLSNIGGETSEMSAISLYFYNHVVTQEHAEISGAFSQISRVEMRHLELFANAAFLLGADPRLWARRGRKLVYWSPKYNTYSQNLSRLLTKALYAEYMAVEKYTRQAKKIKDPALVALLERIIQDEKEHIRVFRELLLQL